MMRFILNPVAPFRLDLTVWALRRDPRNQVDRWDGREYRRVLMIEDTPVETVVVQQGPVGDPQLAVIASAAGSVRNLKARASAVLDQMLGLSLDMSAFYAFSAKQRRLNTLTRRFRGVKPPRFPTVWEALVNAISCQQLSLSVGIILMNRLAAQFGPTASGDAHALPRPIDLAGARIADLRAMGYSTRKVAMILDLAQQAVAGQLHLEELESLDDEPATDRLEELRGIGRWSAQYVLLRGLRRLNVFPADDVGFQNKLTRWLHLDEHLDYEGVHRVMRRWRTYGGIIYFFMLLNHLAERGHILPTRSIEAG